MCPPSYSGWWEQIQRPSARYYVENGRPWNTQPISFFQFQCVSFVLPFISSHVPSYHCPWAVCLLSNEIQTDSGSWWEGKRGGKDKGETVTRIFNVREGIYFPIIGNSHKLNQIKRKRWDLSLTECGYIQTLWLIPLELSCEICHLAFGVSDFLSSGSERQRDQLFITKHSSYSCGRLATNVLMF